MDQRDQKTMDDGKIVVLMERLKSRIPELLVVKERIEKGDTLSELEMIKLSSMLEHANDTRDLLQRHPELQKMAMKIVTLYNDIVNGALENEKKRGIVGIGPKI